jgi:predicted anti-sigma-YlaC factor YlaD
MRAWPLLLLLATGCKSIATGAAADALSGSGGVYAQDDDPELVAAAVPFALKTMEGVLVEQPEHLGLLTSLTSGFVQYGYAFVLDESERLAESDVDRAQAAKKRARKLFARARKYGLRGLDVAHEGLSAKLDSDLAAALSELEPEDLPILYWTTAAWALEIGASNLDPSAIADFTKVKKLADRAIELDEAWQRGTVHELLLSLEMAAPGGSKDAALKHYERALALSGGTRAGTYVTYAESICVKAQDAKAFHKALDAALAIDLDLHPEDRLGNVIAQRKAARLKAMADDLILDSGEETPASETSEGATP